MLLTTARITDVSQLSPRFVTVALRAEAFGSSAWAPGAKLQLRPRRGSLGLRTYTPTGWDGHDAAQASTRPFDLVVSGDAATVHAVRRNARQWPRRPTDTKAKAYWAKGRTGLD
jgi:NADPH-dependent ferric siderophore reductase